MKANKSTVKTFTNERKIFVCRVVLLAPIICILTVFLVLLICMEFLPGQNRTVADGCRDLNCTAQYGASSVHASCISNTDTNSTKATKVTCLHFKVWCALEQADNNTLMGSVDTSRSYGNNSWKKLEFCLANLTQLGFSQDTLLENGSNFIREIYTNDGTFPNCALNKTKARAVTPCSRVINNIDDETAMQERMRKNTRTAGAVLAAFLSVGLLAFFLMCVYTRRTLKLCCHLCYDDEI
jgi:hypothetical protein